MTDLDIDFVDFFEGDPGLPNPLPEFEQRTATFLRVELIQQNPEDLGFYCEVVFVEGKICLGRIFGQINDVRWLETDYYPVWPLTTHYHTAYDDMEKGLDQISRMQDS